MKTTIRTTYVFFVLGLVLAAQAFAADVSGTVVSLGNFQLISKTRVDRFNYDYVYKLDATNSGAALTGVAATLTNPPQGTAFLDAQVSFGDLATNGKTTSTDTFSFRQDRRFALAPENLAWQVSGELWVPTQAGTISGRVTDTQSSPLANASVRVGNQANPVQTDTNGHFEANFQAGDVQQGNVVLVNARATGFVETQGKVPLSSASSYLTNLTLKAIGAEQTFSTPQQSPIELTESGISKLGIAAAAILDSNQQPVTEPVTVQLTALDPTKPEDRSVFPGGDFLAIDPNNPPIAGEYTSLESIALAEVKLLGASGATYSRIGSPATLEMVIPESLQARHNAGDTIPLWFYDTNAGLWKREGDSTVFVNATDGKKWIRALVSHFSWWNADMPIATHACLKFKPVDAGTGLPLVGHSYYLDGVDYTGRSRGIPSLDEVGINGMLDAANPQPVLLLIGNGASNYYLEQAGPPDLYSLSSNPATARIFNLPIVQGNYSNNPANCADYGTIRIDQPPPPPPNSPPMVNVFPPGPPPVTCGEIVTITADFFDIDGNLTAPPPVSWETEQCGSIVSTVGSSSTSTATIQWKSVPGLCEVRLSVTDDAGALGTGSTQVDCACPDGQHWNGSDSCIPNPICPPGQMPSESGCVDIGGNGDGEDGEDGEVTTP